MKRKIQEWLSIQIAKRPGRVVLISIFIFNVVFFLVSATVISQLSVRGTEKMPFIQAAFSTITMILDPGCVQFVVEDIGQMGVAVAIACLVIIFVGMVSFTGAVIGYIIYKVFAEIFGLKRIDEHYTSYEPMLYVLVMILGRFLFFNEFGAAKLIFGF